MFIDAAKVKNFNTSNLGNGVSFALFLLKTQL